MSEAVGELIERLERGWLPVELLDHPELHAYEPMRMDQFADALAIAVVATPGRRYLEVGSGIGTKLLIAHRAGLEAHGIEAREAYVAVSRYLCPEVPVELADARGYANYGAFDIIYCYKPLVSFEAMATLTNAVRLQVRPGTLLIYPYWEPAGDWRRLTGPVWAA